MSEGSAFRFDRFDESNLVVDRSLGTRSTLERLRDEPKKIVRRIDLEKLANKFGEGINPHDAGEKAKSMLAELERYGVRYSAELTIQEKDGRYNLFVVADEIDGVEPKDIDFNKDEALYIAQEFSELYFGLATYIQEKYETGEIFLWDVAKNRQYLYGKKDGDARSFIYLVDLDLNHVHHDRDVALQALVYLASDIGSSEKRWNIRFEDARRKILHFVDNLSESDKHKFSQEIKDIKAELAH